MTRPKYHPISTYNYALGQRHQRYKCACCEGAFYVWANTYRSVYMLCSSCEHESRPRGFSQCEEPEAILLRMAGGGPRLEVLCQGGIHGEKL